MASEHRLTLTATFADVLRGWQTDAAFRASFNELLASAPYTAFRWELPALTAKALARTFECVVVDCPELARSADPSAFAEHLAGAGDDVLQFPNLGGDAILLVPRPLAEPGAYSHLAAFVRGAPATQRDTLWRRVGEATSRRIGSKPVWLSTAGDGVPWLHVRLDDRPKYYAHGPYRSPG